eukprot:Sspe_Gene.19180::Locus_6967_Transcript_1_1_Confidence_1.000_Length_1150::g.19180::m.19180
MAMKDGEYVRPGDPMLYFCSPSRGLLHALRKNNQGGSNRKWRLRQISVVVHGDHATLQLRSQGKRAESVEMAHITKMGRCQVPRDEALCFDVSTGGGPPQHEYRWGTVAFYADTKTGRWMFATESDDVVEEWMDWLRGFSTLMGMSPSDSFVLGHPTTPPVENANIVLQRLDSGSATPPNHSDGASSPSPATPSSSSTAHHGLPHRDAQSEMLPVDRRVLSSQSVASSGGSNPADPQSPPQVHHSFPRSQGRGVMAMVSPVETSSLDSSRMRYTGRGQHVPPSLGLDSTYYAPTGRGRSTPRAYVRMEKTRYTPEARTDEVFESTVFRSAVSHVRLTSDRDDSLVYSDPMRMTYC